jgi:hypothetical protein
MVIKMELEPSLDPYEWMCITKAKQCAGQDPCYFTDERERCPLYGFRIKVKKVGLL